MNFYFINIDLLYKNLNIPYVMQFECQDISAMDHLFALVYNENYI